MRHLALSPLVELLAVTLFLLAGCGSAAEQESVSDNGTQVPTYKLYELTKTEPIRQASLDHVFMVTWFERPFSGSYDQLVIYADNRIEYWRISVNRAAHGISSGQLNEEEREEVRAILEGTASDLTVQQPEGAKVITLSFSQKGEIRVLSFNDLNCPEDIYRLLEIADVAFRRDLQFPGALQKPCSIK